jgi:inosine-uridine nucleoside N-ribohydrolase
MPVDHVDTDAVQDIVIETHMSADDVLVGVLEAATVDEPVTICTIGPVTNIAAVLIARPDLLDRVARIQMMGGCLGPWQANGVEGSLFEFNVGCDPLATSVLFSLPVRLGVVPIDVTIGAFLGEEDRATIGDAGRLGAVLDVLMNNFLEFLRGFMPEAKHNVFLHDPLTVATLAYPQVAGFEPARVSAFGTPGACRMVESPHGRLIDACRSVDNRAIADLMIRTLTSGTNTGTRS